MRASFCRRKETGQAQALAVVDGCTLLWRVMVGLDLCYGGQFKELSQRLQDFGHRLEGECVRAACIVNALQSNGLSLRRKRKHCIEGVCTRVIVGSHVL